MATLKSLGYAAAPVSRGYRFIKRINGKPMLMAREVLMRARTSANARNRRIDINVGLPATINTLTGQLEKVSASVTVVFPRSIPPEVTTELTKELQAIVSSGDFVKTLDEQIAIADLA